VNIDYLEGIDGHLITPGPIFLRGVVGSTAHGLALPGTDDRDEMGVCLEGPLHLFGLQHFEQSIFRTAAQREGKQDARSQAGDLDIVVYGLRKFCRLALKGNPTILTLLYLPEYVFKTELGGRLIDMRHAFRSKRACRAFYGYLTAQLDRLMGVRGQKRVTRPNLVEAHGYDTKYAMHMLRLAYQGIEYAKTGDLTLPMPENQQEALMNVRRGKTPLAGVLHHANRLMQEFTEAMEKTSLPEHPKAYDVDLFLVDVYTESLRTSGPVL